MSFFYNGKHDVDNHINLVPTKFSNIEKDYETNKYQFALNFRVIVKLFHISINYLTYKKLIQPKEKDDIGCIYFRYKVNPVAINYKLKLNYRYDFAV